MTAEPLDEADRPEAPMPGTPCVSLEALDTAPLHEEHAYLGRGCSTPCNTSRKQVFILVKVIQVRSASSVFYRWLPEAGRNIAS